VSPVSRAHSAPCYSKISLEWLKRVFDPETWEKANGKPRVLICDGFGSHETLESLEFCFEHNIILCRLASHTSHKLQPCDVSVFAPLKTAYRDQVERLNRGEIDAIGKEHFTSLYAPAREKALTKRNILAGWAATGLFPFNPERVLRSTPKLPPELTIPTEDHITGFHPRPEAQVTPVTPVTPVTTEDVVLLHSLIKQDVGVPDERSRQRLQRRVQKLASAAQISFAKQHLLQDHNRLLARVNSEAKVRRSTRSIVLGKAKVMSYEDLVEARAKRTAKEKAAASKKKRGRKRNGENSAPDAEAGMSAPMENVTPPSEPSQSTPWRAPVARMY
jgi:hypothetical protein